MYNDSCYFDAYRLFEITDKLDWVFKKDQSYFKNDFDILSVQRNLKILGIFVRLYKRDKKPNYLKYLPHTWSLLERRMRNPIFNKLNILFKKHLPLKKLKKVKI